MAIKKDVHDEMLHRGYKCYDGRQLLLFDFDDEFYERDTSSMTEQTYLDKEKQIASFIRSGERLQNFRRSEFDYPDGEVPDDAMPDPTAALGFDLADASDLQKKLNMKAAASNTSEEVAAPAEGVAGGTAEKSSPPTAE